jgi:hypothetical protein
MLKRVLFGILWCVLIYFVACILVGAVARGIAGSRDSANASAIGAQAGAKAVADLRGYIFAGAVGLSAIGTCAGALPGTRSKRPEKKET